MAKNLDILDLPWLQNTGSPINTINQNISRFPKDLGQYEKIILLYTRPLLYALLRPFCCNAPGQCTPLLNLSSLIFHLTPFGWLRSITLTYFWTEYNLWFTPTSSGMKLGCRKQGLGVSQLVLVFHCRLHMSEITLMWHDVLKSSCKKEVYCLTKIPIKQASNPSKNKWNYYYYYWRFYKTEVDIIILLQTSSPPILSFILWLFTFNSCFQFRYLESSQCLRPPTSVVHNNIPDFIIKVHTGIFVLISNIFFTSANLSSILRT